MSVIFSAPVAMCQTLQQKDAELLAGGRRIRSRTMDTSPPVASTGKLPWPVRRCLTSLSYTRTLRVRAPCPSRRAASRVRRTTSPASGASARRRCVSTHVIHDSYSSTTYCHHDTHPSTQVNPLSSKVGTLTVDEWAVTFGTARRAMAGCGPAQSPPHCTKCNSPLINGKCTNFTLFDAAL